MLRYRIEYDHGARKLLVRVIEARVWLTGQTGVNHALIVLFLEP